MDETRKNARIPLLAAAIILTVAGIAGWLLPWLMPQPAAAAPDVSRLVETQKAVAELGADVAALEAALEMAAGTDVEAIRGAGRALESAFLGAIERLGDGAGEAGEAKGTQAAGGWQSVVDNLLVLGFEESRTFNAAARSWTAANFPEPPRRDAAVRPLGRLLSELQGVVFSDGVVATALAGASGGAMTSGGASAADGAGAGIPGRYGSVASLLGLVATVIAGLLLIVLVVLPGRTARAGVGGPAAAGSRPPASRFSAESGAATGSAILSDTDPVTGAEGRSVFDRTLRGELSRTQRYSHPLSLVTFSVDPIAAGVVAEDSADYVLRTIGEIVQNNVRVSDIFARLADNLFVVLLTETAQRGAERVAEKLRRNVEVFPFDDIHPCTVSVGVSAFLTGDDANSLLLRAENACKSAAAGGGNRVTSQ